MALNTPQSPTFLKGEKNIYKELIFNILMKIRLNSITHEQRHFFNKVSDCGVLWDFVGESSYFWMGECPLNHAQPPRRIPLPD